MENNSTFNLIEGTFSPAEARTLLLSFINARIIYCNRALLNAKLFGGSTVQIEQELQQLESKKTHIDSIIKQNNHGKAYEQSLTVSFQLN